MKYTEEEKAAQAEELRKSKLIGTHDPMPSGTVFQDIKEIEEIATEFERKYNDALSASTHYQKENKNLSSNIANVLSENKTLRDLGTSLEQEIEVLKSPRDQGYNLVIIDDLKKEVEIQSAKVMSRDIELEKWREWCKTFPQK